MKLSKLILESFLFNKNETCSWAYMLYVYAQQQKNFIMVKTYFSGQNRGTEQGKSKSF